MDEKTFEYKRLVKSIDKLANSDPQEASLNRGLLFHCIGDLNEAIRWIENARRLGAKAENVDGTAAVVYLNLGHFSRSLQRVLAGGWRDHGDAASMLLLAGAYAATSELAADKEISAATDMFHQTAGEAAKCAMTLQALNISEDHLRKVLDLAGSVLRGHKLFYVGNKPIVHALGDGYLYQLEVAVEPHAAAEMTDEVISLMVDNDLDAPGLAFAFIGTKH